MINNAIIIHGPGRSGTSLFNSILSLHPDLGYLSNYVNRFPNKPWLSILNGFMKVKALEIPLRKVKKLPRSAEGYNFWLSHIPGWRTGSGLKDISQWQLDKIEETLNAVLKYQGKDQLMIKLTTISRIEVLTKIFNQPKILYIDRDPRAVIYSYLKQKWYYKSKVQQFNSMSEIEKIDFYISKYQRNISEKEKLQDSFGLYQLKYENLVEDPQDFFKKVCDYSELTFYPSFSKTIESWNIKKNTNETWKTELSTAQIDRINEILGNYISGLGYSL